MTTTAWLLASVACQIIIGLTGDVLTDDSSPGGLPAQRSAPRKGLTASASKPIVIRIRTPDSSNMGRIMPNLQSSMSESQVLRLKPVIRFHPASKPDTPLAVDPDRLYNALREMGLTRMAFLLKEANLGGELLGTAPLTVFSPTDEAFSLAPKGFLQTLLKDNNQGALRNILLHHVIRGHLHPEDTRNDFTMPTLHQTGTPLRFNIYSGGQVVSVSGAQFMNNVRLVDGVLIQAVDRILYPLAETNLLDKLKSDFRQMYSTLFESGLSDQLSSGTFTVFAPTNEAFEVLPQKAKETLLGNTTLLRKVALNHIVPGTYFSAILGNGFNLKPLGGGVLLFTSRRGLIFVNGVAVVQPDQATTNGVVHGINRLLVPEELVQQCKCMQSYPMTPATLRPMPPAENNFQESQSTQPDGVSFGTRIKTAVTSTKFPQESNVLESTDDNEPQPGWPETTETGKPLSTMLTDPVDLGDGRRATFDTANNLLQRSILISRIRRPGASGLTLVLPTDRAFSRLPPSSMDELRNDPIKLSVALGLHMVEGRINPVALRPGIGLRTVGGRTVLVNVLPQRRGLLIGGVPVLAIRRGTNGVVLVVDKLINPSSSDVSKPTAPEFRPSISSSTTPADDDELSIWRGIIDDVPDLKRDLKSRDKVYTMFAPTNAAFSLLPPDHLKRLLEEESLKRDLIRSHVMAGALYRNMLTPDLIVPSLKGNKLRFNRVFGGFEVNTVPVTRRPIITSNGVVFIIDRLLFSPLASRSLDYLPAEHRTDPDSPNESLEEIAMRHNATTFLKWIYSSGLRDTIVSQGPCTIILPTNAAVDTMSPTLRLIAISNRRSLRRLVMYHICKVPLTFGYMPATTEIILPSMLPNRPIRCNAYKNNTLLTMSGSPVNDIVPSKEGVDVVIVNRTMAPPVGDLSLTMAKSPLLRNFSKIVRVSGLDLDGDTGPFTVFAPSKCTFERLTPEKYQELITDPDAAKGFVQRHIVKGSLYTTGMSDRMVLTTLAGNQLTITILPDCILVNDVKMRYGDLGATNGVIHIMDNIL